MKLIKVSSAASPLSMPDHSRKISSNYKTVIFVKVFICVCLAALVIISFLVDISSGAAHLSVSDVAKSLLFPDSVGKEIDIIVRTIRLPIAIMALLVGSSLAVAGMEMQTILNNPLASPYTLGISSAASFGAGLSIVVGYSILPLSLQNIATPVFAFVFSLGSSLLIYFISKFKKGMGTIILSGIAVNFMFSALYSVLTYIANNEALRALTSWTQGNIIGATWQQDFIVFLVIIITLPFLIKDSWKLTALCMGDITAKSLGVQVEKLRIKVLVLSAVITAVAVCFVGTIGFIGLVAPYLAKMLVGEEQRFFIPASLLTGAFIMSVSSVASKTVIPGGQVPIGIVTSIIGIPFLLMLILKKGR
jgi:iron complex transport system permease protein